MSEQQTQRGKFKEIDLQGKTIEEYCKEYCISRGITKSTCETWREVFLDINLDNFFIVNNRLFQILEIENLDSNYYTQIDEEVGGIYSFYSTYYNGDTCLTECLKDGLQEMLIQNGFDSNIHYSFDNETWFLPSELILYKEESMKERKYADLRLDVDQDDKLATEVTIDGGKIIPPENYLIGKITQVDNGMLVEFVKKQLQLPKTYAECCGVLSISPYYNLRYHTYERCYNEYATADKLCSLQDKLNILGKLLICRDAYWKIAGEQMGLDKPLKPNWSNGINKYCLLNCEDRIIRSAIASVNTILAFPTAEMRDMFYENFKDLIEQCKELL